MPRNPVSSKTMGVGKKRGGRHWTQGELDKRAAAEEEFKRKDKSVLKPPEWLSKDAQVIWRKKIKEISGLNGGEDLLDALDSEILALFCDAVIRYKKISNKRRLSLDDHKLIQTYMLRILGYSERLGFTPGARARLIKKRADEGPKDEFGEMFD